MSTLPNKELFRLDEAALILEISKSTLYRWIDQGIPGGGELDVRKIGGRLKIARASILRIIQQKRD